MSEESQENSEIETEKVIYLRKPIVLGDTTYDKLELREPTGGEIEKAAGRNTVLISNIAKVPRIVAERLCGRDYKEATDFLVSFIEGSQ